MRRNSLGVRWGLGVTGAGVRREMKSPGTTSEERLRAEARGRCRSCTSEPAIPCVVTRDGLELYARGYRSSTSFGSMGGYLEIKLVKLTKVFSRTPDEAGVDEFLSAQVQADIRAGDAGVLWKANAAVWQELGCLNPTNCILH